MRPFRYESPDQEAAAVSAVTDEPAAAYLAGGTNLLDLMKEDVARPTLLVDLRDLNLAAISEIPRGDRKGGLRLGALAKNADTANHPLVRERYPLLTQAILAGASGQIRNMASNGGNLNQRTRCPYFYEVSLPCNKREPGSGCAALEGFNRNHAIFGWSKSCVATHPSDMAVALAALEAVVQVRGADGKERSIPFAEYHRLPGTNPERDNTLAHGELVTAIELPPGDFAERSRYLKVRDRASYAFALVSVAAALEMDGDTIRKARIAMGGVAHKPWRATPAEQLLVGKKPSLDVFEKAADAAMEGAKPLEHNGFKVELGRRMIVRALTDVHQEARV